MQPTPLELLRKCLAEYKRDLEKSTELYKDGKIDVETHLIHKENIRPTIVTYEKAINILEINEKTETQCDEIHDHLKTIS